MFALGGLSQWIITMFDTRMEISGLQVKKKYEVCQTLVPGMSGFKLLLLLLL